MSTSSRIKARRKVLGLSQEDLALRIGADQGQISRYESGKNEPGADVLISLAKALDTTTDWLLGLTKLPDRPLRGEADLSEDELEVIEIYRAKNLEKRHQAIEILRVL